MWAPALRPALRAVLAGILLLCVVAAARAQPRSPNYLLEIDAPEELRDALRSRTLLGRWQFDPGFEAAQMSLFLDRAQQEAEAIAHAAGYFSARVAVTQQANADAAARVRIEVDAGARTTVGRLALRVDGVDASLSRAIADEWPLPEGSFFNTEAWELGKRQVLERLQQHGYLRAQIAQSMAEVDPDTTAAGLTVSVQTGERLAFGALVVNGLARYPRGIVDALRPFREGEPYSFDRLLLFQERLRAEGWFTGVSVIPDLAAIEADPTLTAVPVLVDLQERSARRVSLGVGYSTDQRLRGLVGYEHRNLLGRGLVLESGVLAEAVRRRLYVSVRTPWDEHGHRWQAGVRSERLDVSGELTDKNTFYVGRGSRRDDVERFVSLQYQIESREVDLGGQVGTDRSRALTLGYAWNLRRLDSRVDPRSGYSLSAQVSGAAKALGSDRSFTRIYGRAMRFWPMPAESTLAGGVLVGLVEAGMVAAGARDGVPSENLFRAGGAQSIRGYRFLSLGVAEGDAIVGGRVLALGSLEYQHPITGDWYGAAFFDIGNAADRWVDWSPVRGAGVGLRWRSPIGPVNLDVAYGDADRRWRVHFSVGYSF